MSSIMVHPGGHKGARHVTIEEVRALPHAPSLGPRHRPVQHIDLVTSILAEAQHRRLEIERETYALTPTGDRMFALFLFKGGLPGMNWAMGVRNSVDQDFGIRGVAGANVNICDNGALSGSEFLFTRKNTTGLVLAEVVVSGFNKYLPALAQFDEKVKVLQGRSIEDNAARVAIYKAFVQHHVAPLRLLPAVDEAYFVRGVDQPLPTDSKVERYPEVTRTVWGIHNAFTRVFKTIESPLAQQAATRKLGSVFGI